MNRSEIFLAAYRKTGSVTRAAEAAQIERSMHYRRMREDPKYVQAFADAKVEAVDVLVDEATRRAVEGWEEPVTYQGRISMMKDRATGRLVPVTIRKFSDSNLQFLLRGAKPETYRERHQHDVKASLNLRFAGGLEELLALYYGMTHETELPDS